MPPVTLMDLTKRLTGYELTTETVLAPKPDAPAWDSVADFLREAVERKEILLRVYSVESHATKIVVPDTYARQLDDVRHWRLSSAASSPAAAPIVEPDLSLRALPEDFIAALDALPCPDLIERLYLMNESNPLDPVHQKQTGDPLFESQASAEGHAVTFFRKNIDPYVGDEVRHEWAHLARWAMPTESSNFDLAAEHEGMSYFPRERARADKEEYWSVLLGEEMLSPDSARFAELTEKAPLPSLMLARGLVRIMESRSTGSEAGELHAAEARARIRHVLETIGPRLIDQLVSEVRNSALADIVNTAARLLICLGQADRLNDIATLQSLNLSGDPIGAVLLAPLVSNRNIDDLNLSKTYVGLSGFAYLENLPLRHLSLAGTRTTGSALRALERISTLKILDLGGTHVGDNGLSSLRRMPALQHIDLRGTDVTPEGVAWLRQQMPHTTIEL
ncbi:MAG: hypothetical protein ABJF10_04140 [Chthoniobacter sp.]|uniref:hypothetical protein n=1 Tax=Chthoniobacter sp. TaxID=2510640 RepID=UPI0032AC35E1